MFGATLITATRARLMSTFAACAKNSGTVVIASKPSLALAIGLLAVRGREHRTRRFSNVLSNPRINHPLYHCASWRDFHTSYNGSNCCGLGVGYYDWLATSRNNWAERKTYT